MATDVSLPHLQALIERMGELNANTRGGYYPLLRPLVTIEQFFKGSNGNASLWSNQWPEVASDIDESAFWRSIRDRADVWDVLISVSQFDFHQHPFEDSTNWVLSDIAIVITSAEPEDVLGWFPENAVPEQIADSWDGVRARHEKVFVPSNMKPLFLWYD